MREAGVEGANRRKVVYIAGWAAAGGADSKTSNNRTGPLWLLLVFCRATPLSLFRFRKTTYLPFLVIPFIIADLEIHCLSVCGKLITIV